jgi:neopullulanase
LDVPGDIDDDSFWQEFRRVVKRANPEAYICGEIWTEAQRWLQGDQFDAVMNYIFAWNTLAFFGGATVRKDWKHKHLPLRRLDASAFARNIDHMHSLYDWEINYAQLNLLDSHDMPRALYLVGEDKSALRLSVMFQMTMPGAPCIYYGDEIGFSAGGDPDCREAFPWQKEANWDWELLSFYRQAIALRCQYPALRTGSFKFIYARGKVCAFLRKLEGQQAVVVFNTRKTGVNLSLPLDESFTPVIFQLWPRGPKEIYRVEDGTLNVYVPKREVLVLVSSFR